MNDYPTNEIRPVVVVPAIALRLADVVTTANETSGKFRNRALVILRAREDGTDDCRAYRGAGENVDRREEYPPDRTSPRRRDDVTESAKRIVHGPTARHHRRQRRLVRNESERYAAPD